MGTLGKGKLYEYKGQMKTIRDWVDQYGVSENTLRCHMWRGESFEQALDCLRTTKTCRKKPVRKRLYEYRGKKYTGAQLQWLYGVRWGSLEKWVSSGMSVEEVIEKVARNRQRRPKCSVCCQRDCLHNDGDNTCVLMTEYGWAPDSNNQRDKNCVKYEDAFEFYFGGKKTDDHDPHWRDRQLLDINPSPFMVMPDGSIEYIIRKDQTQTEE